MLTFSLQPFFKARYTNAGTNAKSMKFATDRTGGVAPSIPAAPAPNRELVGKWVEHWRSIGFIN